MEPSRQVRTIHILIPSSLHRILSPLSRFLSLCVGCRCSGVWWWEERLRQREVRRRQWRAVAGATSDGGRWGSSGVRRPPSPPTKEATAVACGALPSARPGEWGGASGERRPPPYPIQREERRQERRTAPSPPPDPMGGGGGWRLLTCCSSPRRSSSIFFVFCVCVDVLDAEMFVKLGDFFLFMEPQRCWFQNWNLWFLLVSGTY